MSKIKRMRMLRLKHCISLPELSRAIGVSPQFLSAVELSEYAPSVRQKEAICLAFERVIAARHGLTMALATDYESTKDQLFDLVDYENEEVL